MFSFTQQNWSVLVKCNVSVVGPHQNDVQYHYHIIYHIFFGLDVRNRTRVYLRRVLEYEPGSQMETAEMRACRETTLGSGKTYGGFCLSLSVCEVGGVTSGLGGRGLAGLSCQIACIRMLE